MREETVLKELVAQHFLVRSADGKYRRLTEGQPGAALLRVSQT